jgi:hypothetical protein
MIWIVQLLSLRAWPAATKSSPAARQILAASGPAASGSFRPIPAATARQQLLTQGHYGRAV